MASTTNRFTTRSFTANTRASCFTTGIVWLLYVFDEWLEQEPITTKGQLQEEEPEYDQEEGYVELSPIIDKKTKKRLLND